jgi:hypothetical protein
MIILEVELNGEEVAVAGGEDLCVLHTIVNAVGVLGPKSAGTKRVLEQKNVLNLSVGGLTAPLTDGGSNHVNWVSQKPLKIGDKISVTISEGSAADSPKSERPQSHEKMEERKRQQWEHARDVYFEHREEYES